MVDQLIYHFYLKSFLFKNQHIIEEFFIFNGQRTNHNKIKQSKLIKSNNYALIFVLSMISLPLFW